MTEGVDSPAYSDDRKVCLIRRPQSLRIRAIAKFMYSGNRKCGAEVKVNPSESMCNPCSRRTVALGSKGSSYEGQRQAQPHRVTLHPVAMAGTVPADRDGDFPLPAGLLFECDGEHPRGFRVFSPVRLAGRIHAGGRRV